MTKENESFIKLATMLIAISVVIFMGMCVSHISKDTASQAITNTTKVENQNFFLSKYEGKALNGTEVLALINVLNGKDLAVLLHTNGFYVKPLAHNVYTINVKDSKGITTYVNYNKILAKYEKTPYNQYLLDALVPKPINYDLESIDNRIVCKNEHLTIDKKLIYDNSFGNFKMINAAEYIQIGATFTTVLMYNFDDSICGIAFKQNK